MVTALQLSLGVALLVGVAAVVSLLFAWYAWRRSSHPISDRFALLMTVHTTWATSYLLALLSPSDALARFWMPFAELSAALAAAFWFLFVISYTGDSDWIPDLLEPVLVGHAFVYAPLYALNPGGVMRGPIEVARFGLLRVPHETLGPGQLLEILLVYLILGSSLALLGLFFLQTRNLYRKQTGIILGVSTVVVLANGVHLSGLSPHPNLDLTTVFFVVQVVGVGVALFRYDFLDVAPLAASRLLEEMSDPVFVVDSENRIVDYNDAATGYVDTTASRPSLSAVDIDGFEQVLGKTDGGGVGGTEVQTTTTVGDRVRTVTHDVRSSSIRDQYGEVRGNVVVLRDVTERIARERALEAQNERLAEFTGIVSHDLRNPIEVIDGHIELARETGDLDHLETAQESVEHMEELIDELLTLARQGETIDETETVALGALSETTWEQIDVDDATLSIATDRELAADPSRLQQALENLFCNAVEHGATTVIVGDCPEGFYVADDGPGIPPEDRAEVFEPGFTTREDGTGFGLAIVNRIVEAHGWSIAATESDAGGARFEITDLYSLGE